MFTCMHGCGKSRRRDGLRACCRLLLWRCAPACVAQDFGDTPYVQTPQNVVDKMLRGRQGRTGGLRDRSRLGRRAHGHHRRQEIRRARLRRRSRPATGEAGQRARGQGRRGRPRGVLRARSLRNRLQAGDRGHDLSAARSQPDGAPQAARDAQARHAHRVPRLRHGRMAAGPRVWCSMRPTSRSGATRKARCSIWVVPAKAAGKWRWQLPGGGKPHVFELALNQKFQHVEGTLAVDGRKAAIEDAKLAGAWSAFRPPWPTTAPPRVINSPAAFPRIRSRGRRGSCGIRRSSVTHGTPRAPSIGNRRTRRCRLRSPRPRVTDEKRLRNRRGVDGARAGRSGASAVPL